MPALPALQELCILLSKIFNGLGPEIKQKAEYFYSIHRKYTEEIKFKRQEID